MIRIITWTKSLTHFHKGLLFVSELVQVINIGINAFFPEFIDVDVCRP
jgi:hypothetical protein